MTFPDIFDVKMLIVANIFKDFHHQMSRGSYGNPTQPHLHRILVNVNVNVISRTALIRNRVSRRVCT